MSSPRILAAGALLCCLLGSPAEALPLRRLQFLGEARLDVGCPVQGAPLGGLSGLVYDPEPGLYYAISDDPATRGPARFWRLEIDLERGRLEPDALRVVGWTELRGSDGGPFEPFTIDGEGIALAGADGLFVASEGNVERGVQPFVARFTRSGVWQGELPLEEGYLASTDGSRGVRHNLAFESLSVEPDGRFLFTATENALVQDGPPADLATTSAVRILRYDLHRGRLDSESLLIVDPVAAPPVPADGFRVNGLVELLALGGDQLLALERSFSQGVGNSIRLYAVSLAGASNLRDGMEVTGAGDAAPVPARKELVLDLADLGVALDNLEGMALGPRLGDGRETLVMVSDDNFNPCGQVSQFLAFALDRRAISISSIQGAGHRSSMEGDHVWEVEGVVTAISQPGESEGFWIQDGRGDGDPFTSDGLWVAAPPGAPPISMGALVRTGGRVREIDGGGLSITGLEAARVRVLGVDRPLPAPVRLGSGGRPPPRRVIDDDGLTLYEPDIDGIDFFESLEGMRVEMEDALVVGPTSRQGEIVVTDHPEARDRPGTGRGGLRLTADDEHPQRLILDFRGLEVGAPEVEVGDRLVGRMAGVLAYSRGAYRVRVTEWAAVPRPGRRSASSTGLRGGRNRLTMATFNVENLHPGSEHLGRVARVLARDLGGPDIVALQEIQDDSGPQDDGTVSAARGLAELVAAIRAQGGPRYESRQIDPRDGMDGGRPGANIRVALLYVPQRVEFVDRAPPGNEREASPMPAQSGAIVSSSPGLVAPHDPAFRGHEEWGYEPSRKSLVGEFRFRGRTLFVINSHLKSKRGDDPLFGERQPPLRRSQSQRFRQAVAIRTFVDDLLDIDPSAAVVVLGDLNEHEFRPPLRVLEEGGLVNLIERVPPEQRYTYNFRGLSQVLDHVLVSPGLLGWGPIRVGVAHVNADLPAGRRASDHDPVVLEIRLR